MVCYNLEWFGLLVTSGWPANFRISYPETRFIFREKYCQVDGRFANALTILAVNCISQKCFQTPMPCHAMPCTRILLREKGDAIFRKQVEEGGTGRWPRAGHWYLGSGAAGAHKSSQKRLGMLGCSPFLLVTREILGQVQHDWEPGRPAR